VSRRPRGWGWFDRGKRRPYREKVGGVPVLEPDIVIWDAGRRRDVSAVPPLCVVARAMTAFRLCL
jgi:hypothetical protein